MNIKEATQIVDNPPEYVACRICGQQLRLVHILHLRTHNVTRDEYEKRFPDAPLFSQSYSEGVTVAGSLSHASLPKFSMSTKEATCVVDNPSPINWEWLAGFFQAEGCVLADYNRNLPELVIPQSSPEILDDIESFIKSELSVKVNRSHYKIGSNLVEGEFENYRLIVWSRINVIPIMKNIYPYLRSVKREKVQTWKRRLNIELPERQEPLNWDFVAGFYEGDGYLRYANAHMNSIAVEICFTQKDRPILEKLHTFFGKGFIANHRHALEFRVYDGPMSSRKLSYKLLEHLRTQKCKVELVTSLTVPEQAQ